VQVAVVSVVNVPADFTHLAAMCRLRTPYAYRVTCAMRTHFAAAAKVHSPARAKIARSTRPAALPGSICPLSATELRRTMCPNARSALPAARVSIEVGAKEAHQARVFPARPRAPVASGSLHRATARERKTHRHVNCAVSTRAVLKCAALVSSSTDVEATVSPRVHAWVVRPSVRHRIST